MPLSYATEDTNVVIVSNYIDAPTVIGEKRLTYFIWDVYDASLLAPDGIFDETKEFALRLKYLRDVKGTDITKISLEEIKKQGLDDGVTLEKWKQEMNAIFPDIKKSDMITGIRDVSGHAVFYLNDKRLGAIKDKDFTKAFFDIWLGEKTTMPSLRQKLLNL